VTGIRALLARRDRLVLGFLLVAGGLALATAGLAIAGVSDALKLGTAATAITVVVIGFQAWETRRSAEVAQAALHKTDDAIKVSDRLAIESAKARLDARTPHINVSVMQTIWPPTRPPLFVSGPGQPIASDAEFRVQRDTTTEILLEAVCRVTNESAVTVQVGLNNISVQGDYATGTAWQYPGTYLQRSIPPGGWLDFMVREARSVADWAANAEDRTNGVPGRNVIVAEVIFSDTFDNGIVDNWRVEISGYPLEPVPGDPGTYRITQLAPGNASLPIAATTPPKRRRYFLSKELGEEY